MNTELLLSLKTRILAQPDTFDMGAIFNGRSTRDGLAGVKIDLLRRELESCGATACIAGWTLALTNTKIPRGGSTSDILDAAADQMGLCKADPDDAFEINHPALRLFVVENWPVEFAARYNGARSSKGRARAAAARIDHFIATGGAE